MKVCASCGVEKPFEAFHKNKTKRDGRGYKCKSCMKAYHASWYAENVDRQKEFARLNSQKYMENNQTRIREYLETHPCVDCGETDWVVLEFDHVYGSKHKNISYMIYNFSKWENIQMEIEKCEVRCANCHRRVTQQRAGTWRVKDP